MTSLRNSGRHRHLLIPMPNTMVTGLRIALNRSTLVGNATLDEKDGLSESEANPKDDGFILA